ncbi:helix-turn-helix transcriptional regulator [Sporomusa malonica]|nr:helix-turn-helix transcriptional regulator [Sporomusa malonica]
MFILLPELFWLPVLTVISFFSGWVVAAWGYYAKYLFQGFDKVRLFSDILIYSNIFLVVAGMLARNVSAFAGMTFILMGLLVCFTFARWLVDKPSDSPETISLTINRFGLPFLLLCMFVFVITINSGIMYQVVYPAYVGFDLLISFYQVIPYIVAIWLLRLHATKIRQFHILYIGLALLGLAYAFFILLDRSLGSFLVVDTLMLAACGVNDLFWWGILGAMLNYASNPAQILGIGLSMNVLGVWCGGLLGTHIMATQKGHLVAAGIALVIIFIAMFIIPVLNKKLLHLLKEHVFLMRLAVMIEGEQDMMFDNLKIDKRLTDREMEIIQLLLKGYTYKVMAKQLFISENTLKTHIKNIYVKLEIHSRMELIQILEGELPKAEVGATRERPSL